jgi:2-polyprenyl-3-methyl-5-hydroxy-6-metoxy-1,4-benzoquinol methylase
MNIVKYVKSKMVHFMPKWLKVFIYKTWRHIWGLKVKLLPGRYYRDPYNREETLYIDPEKIEYVAQKGFDIYKYKGRVLGGDWDIEVVPFKELDFFKSFQMRVEDNIPWEETDYYKRVLQQIAEGKVKWGCKSKEELDERCSKLDVIYRDMKEHGYREGWNENEITVNIGRNGELLFNNGRHRLTFGKLLGMREIPAKVTVRHKEWVAFKKEIYEYSKKFDNKVYAPLLHPDLSNIPSHYGDERFIIIKNHLTVEGGRLLDIGCHWGYFCHKFEDKGFDCYCVEKSNLNLYFLNRLKESENKKFKVIPHSIFNLPSDMPAEYNVILALSTFHHFIKEEKIYKRFIKFLKNIKGSEMFFEPHNPDEPQMKGAFRNFSNDEFADFIVQNSSFANFERIGFSEYGRPLYRIF